MFYVSVKIHLNEKGPGNLFWTDSRDDSANG
jgi:hypothetical protein